ncbi:hypothetical protein DUNSADRAFT_1649 [Dunaliella salina]|uniref:3CxxC-type domain-containing protein n=1 Tax=Dunaliella salina TaxID=3046 RepID=A0ABQ7GWW2_DUNSA|nr:hypothetical protein DUNSADRAFT_1649 [Dunaliella salina]|eukprot:KAF5839104.1 hypothetical protein DUNSADRAFT_1649 [Dunaliella salina]
MMLPFRWQASSLPKRSIPVAAKKQGSNKPKEHAEKPRLTPYQGPDRKFGLFRCTCGRRWASGNSWANFGQKPLERSANPSKPEKPHPQELCGKCRALGHYCGNRKLS